MKALSIRQPWVWAILNAGKRVENRDWKPRNPGLRFRGDFLIHASAGMTRSEYSDFLDTYKDIECGHKDLSNPNHPRFGRDTHLDVPSIEALERGGIIGWATIVDVVTVFDSPWFFGPLALVLENVKPLTFTPFKGALGFFDVPSDVVAQLREAP
jgi:hypothetical protein